MSLLYYGDRLRVGRTLAAVETAKAQSTREAG